MTDAPVFSKWSYNSPYLPRRIHYKLAALQECFTWLEECPYAAADGSYIGRNAAEATALVIGLLLHDIWANWFSHNDPDESAPTNIPDYVLSSVVEFKMVEETLAPLCQDMVRFMQKNHSKQVIDPALVEISKGGVDSDLRPPPPGSDITPIRMPAVAAPAPVPDSPVPDIPVPDIPLEPAVETGTRKSNRRVTKSKKAQANITNDLPSAEDKEPIRTQPRRQGKPVRDIPKESARPQRGSRRK